MQVLSFEVEPGNLLVPISMVAQIIRRSELQEYHHKLPIVRQSLNWREKQIPLVNSSELLGSAMDSDKQYQRAVVLWPMQGTKPTDVFALTSLNSPRIEVIDSSVGSINRADMVAHGLTYGHFTLGVFSFQDRMSFIVDLAKLATVIYSR